MLLIIKTLKNLMFGFLLFAVSTSLSAQDSASLYKLRLDIPLADFPQNSHLPYKYPSMHQSAQWAGSFYDLGFWGIDELGNAVFKTNKGEVSRKKRIASGAFKYALGLAFSKYGSELPIPLGVWAHEEFHRSVLGVNGISSKNGNWLLSRWDGTVYGPTDEDLTRLKRDNVEALLYSYVAGVQAENMMTRNSLLTDFYNERTHYKNAMYLYNAYYVWNYFAFSTSAASDSVKVLAPPHESKNPSERDFAGADLTAWAYDMFSPATPYTNRDSFPNGQGVNRRIGFSDLNPGTQDFLKKQKTLSLLNFINPAIFFVNRVKVNDNFSFNFFVQYAPTHFGNDIAAYLPFRLKQKNLLLGVHQYNNANNTWYGVEAGIFNYGFKNNKFKAGLHLHGWMQPLNQSYFDTGAKAGGAVEVSGSYAAGKRLFINASVVAKSKGWMAGNPYLDENISARAGLGYYLGR